MRLVVLTAACGVGKTTVKDILNERGLPGNFICIDTDEVGINWHDYAGTGREDSYSEDCLAAAARLSGGRDILFSSCLNPNTFYGDFHIPEEIEGTWFIAMVCSDGELEKRLKARPPERMCGDREFIKSQINYNNWFRKNRGKFQLFLDNTGMTAGETADLISGFLSKLPGGGK